MENIGKIREKLNFDKELDSNIDLLIEFSISNKTLVFEQQIKGINIEILEKAGVLKLQSNKIHILNYTIFGFKFYIEYLKRLSPKLSKDFKSYSIFLEQVESDFCGGKFRHHFINLKSTLWGIAILEANSNFDIDFVEYISSINIDKDKDEFFSFSKGYINVIQYIEIKTEPFYVTINQLIHGVKSDSNYDFQIGDLAKSIRERFYSCAEFGLKCFQYTINQTEFDVDLLIPMVTGLYDKLRLEFYQNYLKELFDNQTYTIAIICGLANVESITNVEVQLFFQLLGKFKKEESEILIYLPRLIFAILKSKEESIKSEDVGDSFKILEELIEIDNVNLINYILNNLRFNDNHFIAQQDLIKKLITKPHFQVEKYLYLINHIIWNQKDVKFFGSILELAAYNCPFKHVSKFLKTSIHEFNINSKVEFDEILVKLLIDNRASFRFVGQDIFDKVSQDSYIFDFNILELESLNQYKLWVSVLQSYREPKYVIPCLLPLLKSSSTFVKEAFICKLEEYSENYGGGLIKILDDKLDLNDEELNKIHKRIEQNIETYIETFIRPKNEINELNPLYTQHKIYTDFNKNYFRSFSKQMKKYSDENNSIISLFSKVTLLKGGGWKIEDRKDISKLSNISSSFSLPRIYYIQPEVFDFENNRELSKNWNDETFVEVINALKNE